jgi:prepilin-type processing-associated H-X9-DG protein
LPCPVEVGSYNGQFEILGNYGSVGSYGVNYAGNGSRPFGFWESNEDDATTGPKKGQGSKKITAVASSEFLAADATLPYIYSPSWRSFKFDLDGDGVLDTSMITTGPDLYNKLEPRHSGSAHMLFVDGSVRLIPLKDWLHGENYLW